MKETKLDNQPLISIIILNYNAGELLIHCIQSILNSKYENYEIIVVDNKSKDNSHKKAKDEFSEINLIENEDNLGYCDGNNIGIKNANGEFIVILNPDTVVDPFWLNELMSAYTKYGEGFYQPLFLTSTDHRKIISAGNQIHIFGFGFARGKNQDLVKDYSEFQEICYPAGAGIFCKLETIKKIGPFDSFLFAYHDDLDLGWRGMLQKTKSYFVPKSIVYHPPEGSSFGWSDFKFYLLERNRIYCILTHYSRSTLIKILPLLAIVELLVWIFYISKGMGKIKLNASINILKNIRIISKKFNEIQKNRTCDDKEIIKKFVDEISIPSQIAEGKKSLIFNKLISNLSKLARKVI